MSANTIDLFHDNRVKPSIDKVTLCGHSSKDILQYDFEMLVARHGKNKYKYEHYESKRFMSFSRLIKLSYRHYYDTGKFEVYTLAIMIGFNGMSMCGTYEEQHKFQIEFNPNKFVIPDWLIHHFIVNDYLIENVKNIDMAFDFLGYSKHNFNYVLNSANTVCACIGSQNNKTDYIGFSDKSNNRIKIYDKRKERSKYYDIGNEVTRLEITLQYKHCVSYNKIYGEGSKYIQNACDALKQVFITDSVIKDVLLYTLSKLSTEELSVAFSLMSVNSRTKYKRLLKNQSNITFVCEFIDMSLFLMDELEKILKDNYFVY